MKSRAKPSVFIMSLLVVALLVPNVYSTVWEQVGDKTDLFDVDRPDPDSLKWLLTQECNSSGCHDVSVQGGTMNTRNYGLSSCTGTQICPDAVVITRNSWPTGYLRATTRLRMVQDQGGGFSVSADFNYRMIPTGNSIWSYAVDIHILTFPVQGYCCLRYIEVNFRDSPVDPSTERRIGETSFEYDPNEWFRVQVEVDQSLARTFVRVFSEKTQQYVINVEGSSYINTANPDVQGAYLFRHNMLAYVDYHIAERPQPPPCCGGGGGGGSVPQGTLITMADGAKVPVQNLRVGQQVLTYDIHTGRSASGTITEMRLVTVDNLLTLFTEAGIPFRADANPNMKLRVLVSGEPVLTPITEIRAGDRIFHYDTMSWVTVTDVSVAFGGHHVMYDLITDPALEYIANGYPDCPCYKL